MSEARPLKMQARRGVILIAVLVAVTMLSLAAYQYSDLMMSEYKASENAHRTAQARALADSGIHFAAAVLSNPDSLANVAGGSPYDNAGAFMGVAVPCDPDLGRSGRFTLIAPLDPEDSGSTSGGCRYGVIDEGGKINVNACMKIDSTGDMLYNALLFLPNMTEEIAASIVDWIDGDGDPRPGGAENDYYSAQSPPYRCKNGAIDSLDELLLVKGVTSALLYGNDLNRNGIQDPGEDGGGGSTGGFDRGWSAYLTAYSRERNADAMGNALIYLNDTGDPNSQTPMQDFYNTLAPVVGDEMAKFVVIFRQYGGTGANGQKTGLASSLGTLLGGSSSSKSTTTGSTSSGTSSSGSTSSGNGSSTSKTPTGDLGGLTPDYTKKGSNQIKSMFDLVNAYVSIPAQAAKDGKPAVPAALYASPLNDVGSQRDLLPKLFAGCTLIQEAEMPARVNVTTAPREVLLGVPGLQDSDVVQIMAARRGADLTSAVFQTPTWLLTEANVSATTLSGLDQYVTARSQVFRVQSVGYFDDGGPAARVEAVIDTNGGRPRIIAWRDLTELGKGWTPSQ